MCTNFVDLSGSIFGRLTILRRNTTIDNFRTYWDCVCECGNYKTVRGDHLKTSKIISCGCFLIESTSIRNTTHGQTKGDKRTTEYISWRGMIQRCSSESYHAKHRYKERGIYVCERWRNSFENFLKDMGVKPTPKHTIDRCPNRNGNYEPSNCRWATMLQQNNNRSDVENTLCSLEDFKIK